MINLISNASKFTKNGEIKIKVDKYKKEKEKKVEPHIDADFLDECVFALSSLGFGKRDAKKAAYEILSEGKIGTVEDFLREVFKRK